MIIKKSLPVHCNQEESDAQRENTSQREEIKLKISGRSGLQREEG